MEDEKFEDILIYFSKSLMGKENEEDIFWDLAKNCISKLGFVDCVVCTIDYDEKKLIQRAAYGPKNPKDRILYMPLIVSIGEGITGHVAASGKPELIHDTSKDDRYIVDDELRLSKICVPIAFENEIYGVIDCEHPEKSFFTEQHLKMLSVIASICAIKIKSIRSNQDLLEKQEKLLKIKEEMVGLKINALNSQLHPHFVFNVINAIQYFVTQGNKEAAMDYLNIFSKLLRFNLKCVELDTVPLNDEIQMLHWYFKLQNLRYDGAIEYKLVVNKNDGKINPSIPSSLTMTIFENLIEEETSHRPKSQKLDISFDILSNDVILKIVYEHNIVDPDTEREPEYRKFFVKWEDQIELLNVAKNYAIEKKVKSSFSNGRHKKAITIKLPCPIAD